MPGCCFGRLRETRSPGTGVTSSTKKWPHKTFHFSDFCFQPATLKQRFGVSVCSARAHPWASRLHPVESHWISNFMNGNANPHFFQFLEYSQQWIYSFRTSVYKIKITCVCFQNEFFFSFKNYIHVWTGINARSISWTWYLHIINCTTTSHHAHGE